MKKILLALVVAASSATVAVAAPTMHPWELPASAGSRDQAMGCLKANEIVAAGGKLELGVWYTDFTTCKKYADDNGIPLLAIWSNASCVHCWYTDKCFTEEKYKEWAATHNAGKVICCFMAGGDKHGAPDQSGSAAYNWMWKGDKSGDRKLGGYPFVVLWWKAKGINYRATGDEFCAYANGNKASLSDASISDRIDNFTARMETQFAGWAPEPEVTYDGGWFTQTNYPYASLQAEASTKNVAVEIVRTSVAPASQTMTVSAPGKTAATVTVDWAAGQLAQTNVIANFDTKWFVKGQDVTLTLMDGENVASTVKIACVVTENSAGNPKWIGKSFDFGEWTMDLDAAKQKVAQKGGSAYTLVSVQGSLWCPDCGNVERNFLDVKDAQGNNRFAAWAKERNIALVTVDIPNFNGPEETNYASPCLLSRTAYESTLARAKEYPQSGADASLTNKMWRSGLGYLTRNEISDAEAAKVFSRNHDLVKKNTYEGGFHRPEDGNANRTGVPIFVLLRKDGSVAARLTRMASVSPMASDKANFDNYMKRFEEMLTIADNNATEIENNYASASNKLTLKANGGSEEASLSHADTVDVFRLDGVGGNASQSIEVTGSSAANVTVSLLSTNAAGKAETLATKSGRLSDGIRFEYRLEKAGSYFAEVKATDITSDDFKLESSDSTFRTYVIKGGAVLVPQEDSATAEPPAGSDMVTIKLTKDTRYFITGMASCEALQAVSGAPAGFYVATQNGNFMMQLTQVDGKVSYQVWNAGSVGFAEVAWTVPESVCDYDDEPLEIPVTRQGGKSGTVTMTVSVDLEATTLPAERYWLVDTNAVGAAEITWADGETGEKTVKLYIDDTLSKGQYDGTTYVVLKSAVTSQAGDVKLVEGMDRFELTVVEDDSQDPGTAYIFDAEPTFARPSMVFARASEGVKLWAKRENGSDGLVAAGLVSSVYGTKFSTENPRDLGALADVAPELAKEYPALREAQVLWWSAREAKDKYVHVTGIPAGETAKVLFSPIGNLKGIAASNTVTIVSVADDAPYFVSESGDLDLIRYVEQNPYDIVVTNLTKGGEVSFRKVSGTLPAGVKVSFIRSKASDAMGFLSVSGAPTAAAGTYECVYQVVEKRGGETVNGLVTRLRFTVADPIMKGAAGVPDPVPEFRTTRTFKDVPVVSEDGTMLLGVLQVTISPTGRVSAKYNGLGGTVSFSSKAWNGYSPTEGGWELQTLLACNKGAEMGLSAYSDGSFAANLKVGDDMLVGVAESDGRRWSKTSPATDWQGYYTVALRHSSVLAEEQEGLAPRGDGYVTLKMDTAAACNSGTFKFAGRLPNGTAFSGSSALSLKGGAAYLPVCRTSSRDILTTLLAIEAKAFGDESKRRCVKSPENCNGYWAHSERAPLKGGYAVSFQACGSYFDVDEDLGGCCSEFYETNKLNFLVDGTVGAGVKVDDDTVKIDSDKENQYGVKLIFNRKTGVITGTFEHPRLNQVVKYTGIVVNGWGEGCGCSSEGPYLPFMSGTYFYTSAGLALGGVAEINK